MSAGCGNDPRRSAVKEDAASIFEDAAHRLHAGGADCVVLCTNTMHKVADRIEAATPLPFLHIADPAGRAAARLGARRVGLLGTAFTMEEGFLKDRLATMHGLEVLVPDNDDRREVHRIIYDELCVGVVDKGSRRIYQRVISSLAERGAEAAVLGCTEIGLLIREGDAALPLIDTTVLHAEAAVEFALADEPSVRRG